MSVDCTCERIPKNSIILWSFAKKLKIQNSIGEEAWDGKCKIEEKAFCKHKFRILPFGRDTYGFESSREGLSCLDCRSLPSISLERTNARVEKRNKFFPFCFFCSFLSFSFFFIRISNTRRSGEIQAFIGDRRSFKRLHLYLLISYVPSLRDTE